MRFLFLAVVLALVAACGSDQKSIPNAVGLPGDVYIIMDSIQWRGRLGKVVDSVFSVDMPGLPRTEPIFRTRWIDPRKLSSVLKQRRNLLFVMTLDNNATGSRIIRNFFTPESIEKIKREPEIFYRSAQNVFSRNQEVMYLFCRDEKLLIQHLKRNASSLTNLWDRSELTRLTRALFKAGEQKGLTGIIHKEYHCHLPVPFGYKLAEKGTDFIWVRQVNPKDDRDIFIARKKYTSQDAFKLKNLIQFRDEVCKAHLFEDPDEPETYLLTETTVPFIPVTSDTVNLNGRFAMNLRGIWRTNTFGMGGPFLGFAVVDETTQYFYYVEGFTYSPGRDQREIMRELEAILHTFRTSEGIPASE